MVEKRDILGILIFLELLLSIYLIYSESQNQGFCIIGSTCETVQNSAYAQLSGIPLSWIGFMAFLLLLSLFYMRVYSKFNNQLYLITSYIGGAFAVYLLSVQTFILKKFCGICVIIDVLMLAITVFSILVFKEEKKQLKNSKR